VDPGPHWAEFVVGAPLEGVQHMLKHSSDAIYLDIGCNQGLMSLPVAAVKRNVICVEPVTVNANALAQVRALVRLVCIPCWRPASMHACMRCRFWVNW
jgi:hypothetical protein